MTKSENLLDSDAQLSTGGGMKLIVHLHLLALFGLSVAVPRLAFPTPGDLDMSFGSNGSVTTQICTSTSQAHAMALTNDGSIVVAGVCSGEGTRRDFAIVRYMANGNVDTSFGNSGLVRIDYATGIDWANAIEIQSDNKIVVAGYGDVGDIAHIALARLNPDGSLDTSFDQDGLLTTSTGASNTYISTMTLDALGRIVVAGKTYNGTDHDFVVARYLADGSLDSDFGTDGILAIPIGNSHDEVFAITIQQDGRIVLAGQSDNGTNRDIAIARLYDSGDLDTSFSSDGIATIDIDLYDDYGYGLLVQPNGKIVVAGASYDGTNFRSCLIRYDEHGDLDLSFGNGGVTITSVYGYDDYAHSVVMQPDGKLAITGVSENIVDGNHSLHLVVARFSETGLLDTSYGVGGYSLFENSDYSQGNAIAIAQNGTLLVAGVTDYDFSLTRFIALDSGNNGSAEAWDVTPDGFHFTNIHNVERNSIHVSDIISVSGLGDNVHVPIVVSNGEYSINASTTYRSTSGWVENGDQVNVRHISAASHEAEVQTTLYIGGARVNNSNDFIVGDMRSAAFTTQTAPTSSGGGALSPVFLVVYLLVGFQRVKSRAIRLGKSVDNLTSIAC